MCWIVIHRIRASGVDAGSAAIYVRTLNNNNIHNATKLKIKVNKSSDPAALLTGYGIDEDDIECLMGALSISGATGGGNLQDLNEAWEILQTPKTIKDVDALTTLLDELGIDKAKGLSVIERDDLLRIAACLSLRVLGCLRRRWISPSLEEYHW